MFLFEYIIKVLLGNANSLFMGVVVVVFGYYGWLLINLYNMIKSCEEDWRKHIREINIIKAKLDKLDSSIYFDVKENIKENRIMLKDLKIKLENADSDSERLHDKLITEINEESDEIKETIKILFTKTIFNNYRKEDLQEIKNLDIKGLNSMIKNNDDNDCGSLPENCDTEKKISRTNNKHEFDKQK